MFALTIFATVATTFVAGPGYGLAVGATLWFILK